MEECRSLLISVLSHSLLSSNTALSHALRASAASLASRLIQSFGLAPLPVGECLAHLYSDTPPSPPNNSSWLTDVELAIQSLKLWQGLALSDPVYSEGTPTGASSEDPKEDSEDEVAPLPDEEGLNSFGAKLSTSLTSWDVLDGVLTSLGHVARLNLDQGAVKEAVRYAQQGLHLAKQLCLLYQ